MKAKDSYQVSDFFLLVVMGLRADGLVLQFSTRSRTCNFANNVVCLPVALVAM